MLASQSKIALTTWKWLLICGVKWTVCHNKKLFSSVPEDVAHSFSKRFCFADKMKTDDLRELTIFSHYCWESRNRTSPHLSMHDCRNNSVEPCNLLTHSLSLKIQYVYRVFQTTLQIPAFIPGKHLANSSCKMSQRQISSSKMKLFVKDSPFSFPITAIFFRSILCWLSTEQNDFIIFLTTVLAQSLPSLHFLTHSLFFAASHFKAFCSLSPSCLYEWSRCWMAHLINLLPIFSSHKTIKWVQLVLFLKLHQVYSWISVCTKRRRVKAVILKYFETQKAALAATQGPGLPALHGS